MILVSGATATMRDWATHENVGRFYTPRDRNTPVSDGRPWAADNGAFAGFDADAFVVMLDKLRQIPGCLFVATPDVVGDAEATLAMFRRWRPVVASYGFPVAFVAQDGLRPEMVPWREFDAFFVGGSTEWKLSRDAESFVGYAKARGLWAHMGRVNSRRRLRHAMSIGCDSIDGGCFSRWAEVYIPKGVTWIAEAESAPRLF